MGNIRWERASWQPIGARDRNPGRGWCQLYSFDAAERIDGEELYWCLEEGERLAMVMVDIGGFSEGPLTEKVLSNIEAICSFFAGHGKEMVLRIVYDRVGKGLEREPSCMELVLVHIRQLGPLLAEYAGSIHTLQGVLVGNWGEMHGSRYLSAEQLPLLLRAMYEATGGSCYMAVRTPAQLRLMEQSGLSTERTGLFIDGLFGSKTHLGTLQGTEGAEGLGSQTLRLPNGGETVGGGDFTPKEVLAWLRDLHLTYLNRVYDGRVLERWKMTYLPGLGNLYDYIGAHLGYRFLLADAGIDRRRRQVWVEVENDGFGSLCRACGVWLKGRANGQEIFSRRMETDPRLWDPGRRTLLSCPLLPGEPVIELSLQMVTGSGDVVRFANGGTGEEAFLGSLRDWK